MRQDSWSQFGQFNFANGREPHFVAVIEFNDRSDIVLTSKVGIINLPSAPIIERVIIDLTSTSQRVIPLKGLTEIGGFTLKALDRTVSDRYTYDFAGANQAEAAGTIRSDLPGKIQATFFPTTVTNRGTVFCAGFDFMRVWVEASTGEIKVWKPSGSGGSPTPASQDSTGMIVNVFQFNRIVLEWDGLGNYTIQLNGETSYSGTYNTATSEGPLMVAGDGTYFLDGSVADVYLWEDFRLKRFYSMDEGSGTAFYDRVAADDLTVTTSPATGTWALLTSAGGSRAGSLINALGTRLNPTGSPESAGEDISSKKIKIYMGFTEDFDDFVQIATNYIQSLSFLNGVYTFKCGESSRLLKRTIFDQKTTRLAASITAAESPLPVLSVTDASEFQTVQHTSAFTDAPSSAVGYLIVEDTGEIMRYSTKSDSPASFTIEARGLFGTTAQAVTVSGSDPNEWPLIKEYIYLEAPTPVLMYALMTGQIWDTGSPEDTLPDHWHAGMSPLDVDRAAFEGIGEDLYTSEQVGLIFRFLNLQRVEAKKFIEEQLNVPSGTLLTQKNDGQISIDRVNNILRSGASDVVITDYSIKKLGELQHKQKDVVNSLQIDWNYDGNDYLNRTLYVDTDSIARNGASVVKKYEFKGLGPAFSTSRIQQLILRYQNRYRNPPMEITLDTVPFTNVIEPNDVVRIRTEKILDLYESGAGDYLDRTFEVQRVTNNWVKGNVTIDCIASSGDGFNTDPATQFGANSQLNDGFYVSRGTDLSTVLTISGGTVTASGTLTGYEDGSTLEHDCTNSASIYYYDGDLTIATGVTVTITHSVQLRVKGVLTINGTIDGAGNGWDGLSAPYVVSDSVTSTDLNNLSISQVGYVGSVRSSDGLAYIDNISIQGLYNIEGVTGTAKFSEFPELNISGGDQASSPVGTDVIGIPKSLTGARAHYGQPLVRSTQYFNPASPRGTVEAVGGDGGDSGAGLAIVCRGLAFGLNGEIDLSGTDGSTGGLINNWGSLAFNFANPDFRAGAGAGGGTGSLFVVIDGGDVALPTPQSNLTATTGEVPINASSAEGILQRGQLFFDSANSSPQIYTGFNAGVAGDQQIFLQSNINNSSVAFRVQYVPETG